MADQVADTKRIRACSKSLSKIHSEFSENSNPASGLGKETLGAQDLVDAFGDFESNWKIHRERLTDELKKLANILSTAAEAYDDIDHQLAEALRSQDKKDASSRKGAK
ncbi:type VII secretion target [Streptomyces sp. A5-4]|uniref:type VII secretion target n=1 Tax=Streptomyces sp. A5-4 TaxID=3384771 RepID=UPI003DA9EDB8